MAVIARAEPKPDVEPMRLFELLRVELDSQTRPFRHLDAPLRQRVLDSCLEYTRSR